VVHILSSQLFPNSPRPHSAALKFRALILGTIRPVKVATDTVHRGHCELATSGSKGLHATWGFFLQLRSPGLFTILMTRAVVPPGGQGLTFLPAARVAYAPADNCQQIEFLAQGK
jgi:hypothetical protein